eukprot:scaffold34885_cov73-Phaeocystis_antarctica.AAC.1
MKVRRSGKEERSRGGMQGRAIRGKPRTGSSAAARLPAARDALHARRCLRAQVLACGGEDALQQRLRQRRDGQPLHAGG